MTSSSSKSDGAAAAAGKTLLKRVGPFLVAAVMIAYVVTLLFLVMKDMGATSAILRGL